MFLVCKRFVVDLATHVVGPVGAAKVGVVWCGTLQQTKTSPTLEGLSCITSLFYEATFAQQRQVVQSVHDDLP